MRSKEKDYIYFKKANNCASFVGRIGGRQDINLADGCTIGNTIHEIAHAVGMVHEQQHYDRDKYINIHWRNIHDSFKSEFGKLSFHKSRTSKFDLNSIMMYASWAYSKNGKPTMTTRDDKTFTVQRRGLSFGDEKIIDQIYN